MLTPGATLDLEIEKPVSGGRMLARHQGQVVLVWGAIPGEAVRARVDRVTKGVVYATTVEVLKDSSDRRAIAGDWRCGGNVYAHVAYPRQLRLKGEVIVDALTRIGRVTSPAVPPVTGSPETGYRMRARLHVRDGRVGFYREESHELCGAALSGQLLPETVAVIERIEERLRTARVRDVASVEIAENAAASERVVHVEVGEHADLRALVPLAEDASLSGLTASRAGIVERLAGIPTVTDVLHVSDGSPAAAVRLRRDVRAFFQGNRFLLEPLVRHVLSLVPGGPVVDLYAGVGLFGLVLAAAGAEPVTLVEGDPTSGADLQANAEAFGSRVAVRRASVETSLRLMADSAGDATFVVDPPRTGMSRDVVAGIIARRPPRIVFVSCDPATLARDVRAFSDAGYTLDGLTGFDLFPNTAHIEAVALLSR